VKRTMKRRGGARMDIIIIMVRVYVRGGGQSASSSGLSRSERARLQDPTGLCTCVRERACAYDLRSNGPRPGCSRQKRTPDDRPPFLSSRGRNSGANIVRVTPLPSPHRVTISRNTFNHISRLVNTSRGRLF